MRLASSIFVLLFLNTVCFSQTLDSLHHELNRAKQPKTQAKILSELGRLHLSDNVDSAQFYLKNASILYNDELSSIFKVNHLVRVAELNLRQNNIVKAEKSFIEAKEMAHDLDSTAREIQIAVQLNEGIYITYNQFDDAIKLALESKSLAHQLKDSFQIYQVNEQLYTIYFLSKSDIESQIKLAEENLAMAEALNNPRLLTTAYFNQALSAERDGNLQSSLAYYWKILGIEGIKEDANLMSRISNNLGSAHRQLGNLDSARYYYELAYEKSKIINRLEGMAASRLKMGNLVGMQGDLLEAKAYCMEAYSLFQEANILRRQDACALCLYEATKGMGDFKEALRWHEMNIALRDSFMSNRSIERITMIQNEYALKQTKLADSIQLAESEKISAANIQARDAKIAQKNIEEERNAYIKFGLTFLLGLIAFFGVYIYRKYKSSQAQKLQLQIAHEEITDSIIYAKRIQKAILPATKSFEASFPNSFIIYKPKDIVAGDFYWMEKIGSRTLFAVADCTGHGVPGAMVSVVCNNGLNRSVREHQLSEPSQILDKTRSIVIEEFEKSEEDVKDGMDIALCCIEGNTLKYAGAHNPLWIIRNNGDFEAFKADKQPIGKFEKPEPFTQHATNLNSGDTVYIFSDGYADQFGGEGGRPGGKKLKAANLKKLLMHINSSSMNDIKKRLSIHFDEWKGDLEQLDDVCVIGVRI